MIPAAGHSRRMGRPKLLLPVDGQSVIARLLSVLGHPAITVRVVVVRADDEPLRTEVQRAADVGESLRGSRPDSERPACTVVTPPTPPPDMRSSVAAALAEIRRAHAPRDGDGWMLIPGDHPVLDGVVIDRLIAAWHARDRQQRIVVPTYHGRRGHPSIFSWSLAATVDTLPPEAGINRLVAEHASHVLDVPVDDPSVTTDLDTPEDYRRLHRRS